MNVSKKCIKDIDGRRNRKHPIIRRGSYVYVVYEDKLPLYVGETGECIRTRFEGDGSGSYKNKDWYERVTHVIFWELPSCNKNYRKLIEAALILELDPSEQGS